MSTDDLIIHIKYWQWQNMVKWQLPHVSFFQEAMERTVAPTTESSHVLGPHTSRLEPPGKYPQSAVDTSTGLPLGQPPHSSPLLSLLSSLPG